MKTAAIYCRVATSGGVSTDEQAKNTSLMSQLEACKAHAASLGYTVVHEVKEEFSGARLDRPGLTQIQEMAERGEIEAVIVYDPERLSRNSTHLWTLMDEFERRRVELLFVSIPRDDTPERRKFLDIRTFLANYDREKILRRGHQR